MLKDTHQPPPICTTPSHFLRLPPKLNANEHFCENTENCHKTQKSMRSVLTNSVDNLNPFLNYKVKQKIDHKIYGLKTVP